MAKRILCFGCGRPNKYRGHCRKCRRAIEERVRRYFIEMPR